MGRDDEQAARYLRPGAPGSELPPATESPIVEASRADLAPSSLEWAAMAVGAKQATKQRGGIKIGRDQAVDFSVRIRGTLNVGSPGSSTTREKPSAEALLTTLLVITSAESRQSLTNRLVKMHQTMSAQKIPDGVKEMVDNVVALLTTSKMGNRSGTITGAVVTELVERDGKPPRRPRAA